MSAKSIGIRTINSKYKQDNIAQPIMTTTSMCLKV